MLNDDDIIPWLMEGDVSIQYQTHRDLLGVDKPGLRRRISSEGWGLQYLSKRNKDGHWGSGFYQPKWLCSHYTLLDLKNLSISPDNAAIRETIINILNAEKGADGGLLPSGVKKTSDVCVTGMVLNYASYFGLDQSLLTSVVDFLLKEHMNDGGFNCQSNRSRATHSSLHTTLSVIEGILEYERNGYRYRLQELKAAQKASREFILQHRLFRSDKTGDIISSRFLTMSYPTRWYYDILRALDYFQFARVKRDNRMQDALEILLNKRTRDGRWKLSAARPGQTHFIMEPAGKPSRWNTLRAMRVLKQFT